MKGGGWLIAGGVVVVGLVVLLLVDLSRKDRGPSVGAGPSPGDASGGGHDHRGASGGGGSNPANRLPALRPTVGGSPTEPTDPVDPADGGAGAGHDHRGEVGTGEPASIYKVDPKVMLALRDAIRPIVRQCQGDFASTIGHGAQVEPRLEVDVKAGVLVVSAVEVKGKNLSDTGLADCVKAGLGKLSVAAPGHPDVHHRLTYTYRLPMP